MDEALLTIGDDLLPRIDPVVDRIVDQLMVLPGYRARTRQQQRPDTRQVAEEILRATFVEQDRGRAAALRISRELVRTRAASAVPLSAVTTGIGIGHREVLLELGACARRLDLDASVVARAAVALHDVVEELLSATRLAYEELFAEEERHAAATRARAVRELVSRALTPAELEHLAGRHALSMTTTYRVVRARARSDAGAAALDARLVESERAHGGLVASVDADPAGVLVSTPEVDDLEVVLAISAPVTLAGVSDAFALVTRLLEGAIAHGVSGNVRVDELGLRLWVLLHREIGEFATRRYLASLARLGNAGAAIEETLRAHLACSMSEGETARALHLHRNSVRYRLGRYTEATGLDLHDPEVIAGLWWALASRPPR